MPSLMKAKPSHVKVISKPSGTYSVPGGVTDGPRTKMPNWTMPCVAGSVGDAHASSSARMGTEMDEQGRSSPNQQKMSANVESGDGRSLSRLKPRSMTGQPPDWHAGFVMSIDDTSDVPKPTLIDVVVRG